MKECPTFCPVWVSEEELPGASHKINNAVKESKYQNLSIIYIFLLKHKKH